MFTRWQRMGQLGLRQLSLLLAAFLAAERFIKLEEERADALYAKHYPSKEVEK